MTNHEIFEVSPDIFDWAEIENIVYFSCLKEVQYIDFPVQIQSKCKFIKVPFIPRDGKGNVDNNKLIKMESVDSEQMQELANIITKVDENSKAKLFYDNDAATLKLPRNNKSAAKDTSNLYNGNKAIAKSEPLNLDDRKFYDLVDLISSRSNSSQRIIYYSKDGKSVQTIGELYQNAKYCAGNLVESGVRPGDKLIFQVSSKRAFLEVFWACMLIGAVPAPMTVIEDYEAESSNVDKLYNIWSLLNNPKVLVTDIEDSGIKHLEKDSRFTNLEVLSFNNKENNIDIPLHRWNIDETSLILFTSGSTGLPKGVQLCQKNIFARTLGEIQLYKLDEHNVDLNWMTFTHAAGLIWSHIRDIYMDILQIQVDTEIILKNPLLWIDLINEYRVTITWAPNFAFAMVADNIDRNKEYSWKLDSLEYAFAGGEANISRVLLSFLNALKEYGLSQNCIVPAFGMTETSSCVTYYNYFSPDAHHDNDQFIPVGQPTPGSELRIVNAQGNLCNEGEIGYLQGKGPSYTCGYYKNDMVNKESFSDDGYLITGDLGFIIDNQLTITGREKDIIIINGLNYYVQDFEAAADDVAGVLASSSVATSVLGKSETEEVLIFFTPEKSELLGDNGIIELKQIVESIRKTIQEQCLVNPAHIFPYRAEESARTELGKKQRNKYRNDYLDCKYQIWESKLEDTVEYSLLSPIWIKYHIDNSNSYANIKYLFDDDATKETIMKIDSHIQQENIIESYDNLIDNECLVDFTFYSVNEIELTSDNLKNYYRKLSKHLSIIASKAVKLKIYFPTHNALHITESEQGWNYQGSDLFSIVKTLNQENTYIDVRQIDFSYYLDHLMRQEIGSCSKDVIVAYRGGQRYVQRFKTIENPVPGNWINPNDTVMVVGGMGGIGKYLCSYLHRSYNARLVIIGRSSETNHAHDLEILRRHSCQVVYAQADITDFENLQKKVSKVLAQHKWTLDGIINLAGVLSTENSDTYNNNLLKHTVEKEIFDNYYITSYNKLLGTVNIDKLRTKLNSPYLIVFGSVTAYFGSPAFGAYAGSNSMQEQYCNCLRSKGERVKSVLWSFWNKTGMASGIKVNSYKQNIFQHIDNDDGVACFNSVLGCENMINIIGINRENYAVKHQVIDMYKPRINITLSNHKYRDRLQKHISDSSAAFLAKYINYRYDTSSNVTWSDELQEIWNKISAVWKGTLKIEEVELDDNIFDLGGDSISIFSISSQLTDVFKMDIKAIDIMMNPRIKEISVFVFNQKNNINPSDSANIKDKARQRNEKRLQSRKKG
ncbi:SDR family NAD(P)-dependent oxidoreductase [Lachnospiraceae bacterium ZAX-1]